LAAAVEGDRLGPARTKDVVEDISEVARYRFPSGGPKMTKPALAELGVGQAVGSRDRLMDQGALGTDPAQIGRGILLSADAFRSATPPFDVQTATYTAVGADRLSQ